MLYTFLCMSLFQVCVFFFFGVDVCSGCASISLFLTPFSSPLHFSFFISPSLSLSLSHHCASRHCSSMSCTFPSQPFGFSLPKGRQPERERSHFGVHRFCPSQSEPRKTFLHMYNLTATLVRNVSLMKPCVVHLEAKLQP